MHTRQHPCAGAGSGNISLVDGLVARKACSLATTASTTPTSEEARMAIKGAIPMGHGDVFPFGCYVAGEVQAMRDFDRSTKDQAVQAIDRGTGGLVWAVGV